MFIQSAKFSDRTITNTKNCGYCYAWLVTAPHCEPRTGLSRRRDLAEKASKAAASRITSRLDRMKSYCDRMKGASSKHKQDWADRKLRRVAEVRNGIRIELVELKEPSSVEIVEDIILGLSR